MPFLSNSERTFAEALSNLAYCNPFLAERIDLERQALGAEFSETAPYWSLNPDDHRDRPNIGLLAARAHAAADVWRARLVEGKDASPEELTLYEDAILYLLYDRYRDDLQAAVAEGLAASGPRKIGCWPRFQADFDRYLKLPGRHFPTNPDAVHLFACLFQVRRAFHHIYDFLVGGSLPAAQLRAAVWQSIFTHDMRRYRRSLYRRMGDMTTLVVGPSGTGKELVARAVGLARYIPFDPAAERFTDDFRGSFHPLNLSALSPTLIESELFGHRKGAFTGAVADRIGWLEVCRPLGTVFLDEIGEIDPSIAVKLLRVVQSRVFQRLGETEDRPFAGKIIAATNRDLATEMREGRFREDFYYRLCSDVIRTPTLREQLSDRPGDLRGIVLFLARKISPEESEELADEVTNWIERYLGNDYPWPGNIRELEQCVRNVLIRREYRPASATTGPWSVGGGVSASRPLAASGVTAAARLGDASRTQDQLAQDFLAVAISADELLSRYCTLAYHQHGSYEKAAAQLGLDRRTVRSRVDPQLLAQLAKPAE